MGFGRCSATEDDKAAVISITITPITTFVVATPLMSLLEYVIDIVHDVLSNVDSNHHNNHGSEGEGRYGFGCQENLVAHRQMCS